MNLIDPCRCEWRPHRRASWFRHRWHRCTKDLGHAGNCVCWCGNVCPSLILNGGQS